MSFIDSALGRHKVLISQFKDGDTHIEIPDLGVLPPKVIIYHRLYPQQNERLIELLLMLDLLEGHEVSIFTPYLPYSRQDSRLTENECLSSDAICKLLAKAGCKRLYTLDCHFIKYSNEITKYGMRIISIQARDYLLDFVPPDATLIAPDAGAAHLANNNYLDKKRHDFYADLTIRQRDIMQMTSSHITYVTPKVVIVDDMIATGGTILEAIKLLKTNEIIKEIYVIATHGFFLDNSYERISPLVKKIITTDSVADGLVSVDTIYEDEKAKWYGNRDSNSESSR